jgi:regulator of nucleoside diphosphate kinase
MMPEPIHITQTDAEKIRDLLREAESSTYRGSPYISKLKEELDRAKIVAPQKIAPDVITLRTTAVLLDADTGERMTLTLVFPEDADVNQNRISVLAPIGAAMLGYRVGDTFTWETPGGTRTLRVEKVLSQPEASGDYS